jgi:hypothetical protein
LSVSDWDWSKLNFKLNEILPDRRKSDLNDSLFSSGAVFEENAPLFDEGARLVGDVVVQSTELMRHLVVPFGLEGVGSLIVFIVQFLLIGLLEFAYHQPVWIVESLLMGIVLLQVNSKRLRELLLLVVKLEDYIARVSDSLDGELEACRVLSFLVLLSEVDFLRGSNQFKKGDLIWLQLGLYKHFVISEVS